MVSNFLTDGEDMIDIFRDVKKSIVYLNIFYKANDFIEHGPERISFGKSFRELVDKAFALDILNFEILIRIYFNQLKYVSDFIVFNYLFDNNNTNRNIRSFEKTFYNVYCLHLKKSINKISFIMKTNVIRDLSYDLRDHTFFA